MKLSEDIKNHLSWCKEQIKLCYSDSPIIPYRNGQINDGERILPKVEQLEKENEELKNKVNDEIRSKGIYVEKVLMQEKEIEELKEALTGQTKNDERGIR